MRTESETLRTEWERSADELEAGQPRLGQFPIPGLVRRLRRLADLSQRELAGRAGLSPSTVSRIEAADLIPSLSVLQRLFACADLQLVVVDQEGRVVQPLREAEWGRDGRDRRYPSHLDTVVSPEPHEWWEQFGLARPPPETFIRDRGHRDLIRARSEWDLRAGKHRHDPMPLLPEEVEERRKFEAERQRRIRETPVPDWPYSVEETDDIG
jgi:transcriptional regulator with XRE-family HTH domain